MLRFRPLVAEDQSQLWNWLHIALWDPPPAGPRSREILENPNVRIYAEDWGKDTDVGVVAQLDGQDAGACWMRLLPAGLGLAYVDDQKENNILFNMADQILSPEEQARLQQEYKTEIPTSARANSGEYYEGIVAKLCERWNVDPQDVA